MKHHKHLEGKKTFIDKAKEIYIKDYKRLFLIPLALFLIAGFILVMTYVQTGDFIKKDVSLKGGISITISTDYSDIKGLESHLGGRFPEASINLRTFEKNGKTSGIIIEASEVDEDSLLAAVKEKIVLTKDNYSTESMGSSLGDSFFSQMFMALLIAFICMGIIFHIYFRNMYATGAALFSAFMDIFITLGIMTAFGMRLTAGGIAAYLMLIGYSVDTSILLSTKILKQSESNMNDDIFRAMKTGLTMSAAGLVSTGISFFLTNNFALKQIMLILIVGLAIDILTTWIGNVAFLRFYLEKKNVKAK